MKTEPSHTIRSQIYNQILTDIMNSQFDLNGFLTEKDLMERYGVSRAPVREALMQLRSAHVVYSVPRHGYRIRKPSRQELVDLLTYRSILEGTFLEQFYHRITPENIQQLRSIGTTHDQVSHKDFVSYWNWAQEFHTTLFSFYGNEYALRNLQATMDQLAIYFATVLSTNYVLDHLHSTILDYLEKGDIKTAKMLLQTDIQKGLSDEALIGR